MATIIGTSKNNQTTEFLEGGNDADSFYLHLGTGADVILDVGESDKILISASSSPPRPRC